MSERFMWNARDAAIDFDGWLNRQQPAVRDAIGQQLELASDRDAEKRKITNILWMADKEGWRASDVTRQYEQARAGYGTRRDLGDDWKDDTAFHARIVADATKERDEEWLIQGKDGDPDVTAASLVGMARRAAMDGKTWSEPLGQWAAANAGKNGYDPSKMGEYARLAREEHEALAADAAVARPAAIAAWGAIRDEDDAAALAAFRPLTHDQRALAVQMIREYGDEASEGKETEGAEATGKTLARATDRLFLGSGRRAWSKRLSQTRFAEGQIVRSGSAREEVSGIHMAEAVSRSGASGAMPSFYAQPGRALSAEQAEQWNTEIDQAIEDAELEEQLRHLAQASVDPVTGGSWMRRKVWLPTMESLPTMGALAIPGAWAPAIETAARAYQQDEYTRLRGEGIERGEAMRLSMVSGGAQAAMDYAGVKWLQKFAPRSIREFARFKVAPKSSLGRGAARLGLASAGETATELVQDHIIPAAVDDFLSNDPRLSRDWGEVWKETAKAVPDTFFATLLPTAFFAAAGARGDMEAARKLMKANEAGLRMAGYSKEAAVEIVAAKSEGEIRDLLNKHQPLDAPAGEERIAIVREIVEEATANQVEAEQEAERQRQALEADNITLTRRGGQWIVSDGTNEVAAENGRHAMEIAAGMSEAIAGYDTNQVDILAANIETAEALDASQVEGQESETVLMPGRKRQLQNALDEAEAAGNTVEVATLLERQRIYEQQNGVAEGDGAAAIILGRNEGEFRDNLYRDVSEIWAGGNTLDVFEERIEGRMKAALAKGWITVAEARAVLGAVQDATGDVYVTGETDADVIEGVSQLLRAELFRRRKEDGGLAPKGLVTKSLTAMLRMGAGDGRSGAAKLAAFIRAGKTYLRELIARSLRLRKARAEGKIGENVDAFLAKLAGVEEQAMHNQAVMEAAGVTVESLATSDVKAAKNVDLKAFRERVREEASKQGTGAGEVTFSIGGPSARKFKQMEKDGRVFAGHDGKPRFEMDASKADFSGVLKADKEAAKHEDEGWNEELRKLLKWPELYANYPKARDLMVGSYPMDADTGGALIEPSDWDNDIEINFDLSSATKQSVLLHEIQHWIQRQEGWTAGGDPEAFAARRQAILTELNEVSGKLDREFDEQLRQREMALIRELEGISTLKGDDFEHYWALPGEKEARGVEARAAMTAEERAAKPFMDSWATFSIGRAIKGLSRPTDLVKSPTGADEWGRITPAIAEAVKNQSGHAMESAPIVLRRGEHFSEHRGFGAVHVMEHEPDFKKFGLTADQAIAGILAKPSALYYDAERDRYTVMRMGRPHTLLVMEFRERNGEYAVVTAFPKENPGWKPAGERIWKGSAKGGNKPADLSFQSPLANDGRLSRSPEDEANPGARSATDQTQGNDPLESGESQATMSLGSPEMLEIVARSLENRGKPPKERTRAVQAMKDELAGWARVARFKDDLAGALREERVSRLEDGHARAEHAMQTRHTEELERLRGDHDLEMGGAREEGWNTDRRDALNVRHGRERDALKGRQRRELANLRERQAKEMAAAKKVDPRSDSLRALAAYEAMLLKLPAEVRGKVGGFAKLAGLKTNEARAKYLVERIEKTDEVLERYLRREYDEQLRKLLKRAQPTKGKPGEKPAGKIGAEGHELMVAVQAAMKLDATGIAGKLADLDTRIETDELTAEQEAQATKERELVNLVGDWKNADAARRAAAVEAVEAVFLDGLQKWTAVVEARQERRKALREALIADTGKAGTKPERDARAEKDMGWIGKTKDFFLGLASFREVVEYAFGRDSSVGQALVDAERRAAYQYDDAVQAMGDSISDFFTRLAGGDVLNGERLRYRLSADKRVDAKTWGKMTEMEVIQAALMWAQEDGRRHMEGRKDEAGNWLTEWHFDQVWIDHVTGQLSDEGRAVMAFISDAYSREHPELNRLYRERHGVNLPRHDSYAPLTVKPQQAKAGEVVDPVSGAAVAGSVLTPGALRTRSQSAVAEPDFRDALQTLLAHHKQMEHWKAYYDFAVETQGALGNREVGNAVLAKAGEEVKSVLRKWVDVFAQGGHRDAAAHMGTNRALNRIAGRFARMALVGRAGTLMIQSTQLAAALAEMPTGAYVARFSKLMTGNIGWGDSLNSDFIQRRLKQAPPIVRQALEGLKSDKPNVVKHVAERLGTLISGADALFTAGTYAILLDYHRKLGRDAGLSGAALDSHAHREAERATERVAQPTRMGARSLYENTSTSAAARLSWAFASEARQKLALAVWAAQNVKNDPMRAARVAVVVWGAGGLMAQIIRNIWRDLRDDDDDEFFDERNWSLARLTTGTLAGPLYGIPLLGEAIEQAMGKATGAYVHSSGPLSEIPRAVPAAWNLTTLDFMDSDEPWEDVFRDAEAIMMAAGLFNETAASAASLAHIVRDAFGVADNLIPD